MDGETRNLQNDFFGAARRDGTALTVVLENGTRLTGRLKSYDRFTLLLDGPQGDQIVFKHAISTVSFAGKEAGRTEGGRHDRTAELAHRGPAK
jgi:host factor-I protein